MAMWSAVGAGAASMITDMLNGILGAVFAQSQQKEAEDFTKLVLKNQIRWRMQDLQRAGLNPNLIYGQGNPGNGSSLSVPDVVPVNRREPRLEGGRPDVLGVLLGQADLRIKNAQATNLETQTDLIRADIMYKDLGIQQRDFDLGFSRDMRDTQADFRREALRKMRTDVDLAIMKMYGASCKMLFLFKRLPSALKLWLNNVRLFRLIVKRLLPKLGIF